MRTEVYGQLFHRARTDSLQEPGRLYTDAAYSYRYEVSVLAFVLNEDGPCVCGAVEGPPRTEILEIEAAALRLGLETALRYGYQRVIAHIDSEELFAVLFFRHKFEERQYLVYESIKRTARKFKEVRIQHIPRGMNATADALASELMGDIIHREHLVANLRKTLSCPSL